MRFLADEGCDFLVVRVLREMGHDVRALAEEATRTVDEEIIQVAASEGRILLTEDKDFGWLAFVSGANSHGVVLVRYRSDARHALGSSIQALVEGYGEQLSGSFTVLEPGRARIQPKPVR